MKNLDIENLKDTQLLNEFISAEFDNKTTENNNNTTISDKENFYIKLQLMSNSEKISFFKEKVRKLSRFKDGWHGMYYYWFGTDIIKGNIYIIKQDSHEYSPVINTEKFEFCEFIRNNLDLLYKHFRNEVL